MLNITPTFTENLHGNACCGAYSCGIILEV